MQYQCIDWGAEPQNYSDELVNHVHQVQQRRIWVRDGGGGQGYLQFC